MSLEKLLNIPKELISNPNVSVYNLVKEYYFDGFSESLVYDYLIKNHCIHNDWLLFCEDKKVDQGWIIEKSFFIYNVYYLNKRNNKSYLKRFLNKDKAFSYYIYNEIVSVYNS
ncbi:hypothetical protein B0I03_106166 [Flavobacterium aquaticum]|uniref:Uncharacterized protein n=1 Tax=Flavobacterium aquaticum TaxID=1236486 RepID=A0A327YJ82_9FLAO|nr:hypothetical protein [Flavobacterium aquaticum]RAK21054.1 hypothetical protein B0I03_106166 [Flavobacterium aquaticum]